MPNLPTYDPDWERRWREAQARLEALGPLAAGEVVQQHLQGVYDAHDAQFATLQALIDWRVSFIKAQAARAGYLLSFAPFAADATRDDVELACRRAGVQIEAATRARSRPPLEHPQGLGAFSPRPAAGVTREWLDFETVRWSGGPQRWAVLVERRGEAVSVCVAPQEVGKGVFCGFDQLATQIYRELLSPRLWPFRPGVRPDRIGFYSYVPWGLHGGGSEMFAARALTWTRRRFEEADGKRRAFDSVPAVIAALDPRPAGPHLLIPAPKPRSRMQSDLA